MTCLDTVAQASAEAADRDFLASYGPLDPAGAALSEQALRSGTGLARGEHERLDRRHRALSRIATILLDEQNHPVPR